MVIHRLVRQPRIGHAILRHVGGAPYDAVGSLVGAVPEAAIISIRKASDSKRVSLAIYRAELKLLIP